jgi:WD40 repeat protein
MINRKGARQQSVVRKSNFRHLAGNLWPKSQTHENISLGIGHSLSDFIQTDGFHFALPFASPGGVLAYKRVNDFGRWHSDLEKLEPNLISAHQRPISDFKFSPFELQDSNGKNYSLLATTSADETVKLWKLPDMESENTYQKITDPEIVLSKTDKSFGVIHNIRFHPRVQNVLITTQMSLVRFWDQTQNNTLVDINLGDNIAVTSADFFTSQPYLLATSCSDRTIRLYDIRTPDKPVTMYSNVHSSGAKPASVKCIERNKKSKLFSVGFSKEGSREFATFDLRMGSSDSTDPLQRVTIDHLSSVIAPFWDEDIGVMYLAGKGDANIRFYELDSDLDMFEYLADYTPDTTEPPQSKPQKSLDVFPKKSCDVNKFELGRFIKLTNDNVVKVISFTVNRHAKIAQYFQEDIFPDTWNRKPVTDKPNDFKAGKINEKLKKKEIGITTLKPAEKVSIYDIPEDQGGKERPPLDEDEMTAQELKEYKEKLQKDQKDQPALSPATPTTFVNPLLSSSNAKPVAQIVQETTTTTVVTQKKLKFLLVAKVAGGFVAGLLIAYLLGAKPLLYYLLIAIPALAIFWKQFAFEKVTSEQKATSSQVSTKFGQNLTVQTKKPLASVFQKSSTVTPQESPNSATPTKTSSTTSPLTGRTEFASHFDLTPELVNLLGSISVSEVELKKRTHDEDKSCAAREIDVTNVRKAKQPLLFYVRGRMIKRVSLIPTHYSSMFHAKNASFVLDFGNHIFQYNTSDANRFVKAFAQDIAQEIKAKERGGTAQVMIYDQGKRPDRDLEKKFEPMMWKVLGVKDEEQFLSVQKQHLDEVGESGKEKYLKQLIQTDDDLYCHTLDQNMNIYRLNTELLKFEEEQSNLRFKQKLEDPETPQQWIDRIKPQMLMNVSWEKDKIQPSHKVLSTDSCYIIETIFPSCEVFCWNGGKSDMTTRQWAIVLARKIAHLRTLQYDSVFKKPKSTESFCTITRVIEGAEHVLFKKKFSDFPGMLLIQTAPPKQSATNIALKKKQEEVDVKKLIKDSKILNVGKAAASVEMYNEQSRMWRIQQFDKVAYDDMGHFYTMDAYIALHTYQKIQNGKPMHTIYFWQGRDIKKAERGTSAYKTVEVNDMISGKDGDNNSPDGGLVEKQVRVQQSLEPALFIRLFPVGFIVYRGYYHTREEQQKKTNVFLFDVRATEDHYVHFSECDNVSATYLSAANCAVLVDISASKVYLWCGQSAPQQQIENSKRLITEKLAPHMKLEDPAVTVIKQGSEDSSFWSYFKRDAKAVPALQVRSAKPARMFEITEETGTITATEVFPISQEHLQSEKIYLIDASATNNMMFVWLGKNSTPNVKKFALQVVANYADNLESKVPKDRQYVVDEFFEPAELRILFESWTETSAVAKDRLNAVSDGSVNSDYFARITPLQKCKHVSDALDTLSVKVYSYEQLSVIDKKLLPEAVDSTVLEQYLSDEDFVKVLEMDRDTFNNLPKWKRDGLKKKANLF